MTSNNQDDSKIINYSFQDQYLVDYEKELVIPLELVNLSTPKEELKNEYSDNIIASVFDVTTDDNKKQIDSLIKKLGGLDLLIYNAGFGDPSIELVPETERLTTLTNVNGFVEIVSHVFNYFVAKVIQIAQFS